MKKTTARIPETVDEYINDFPENIQVTLQKMRKAIKAAVPKATEVISYQIPIFKYNGPVASIAAFKNHCSYYTMSHAIMKLFEKELKPYHTSGVTIQFPHHKPLPATLVKKLVLAKIKENEIKLMAKQQKAAAKKQASIHECSV